MTVRSTAWLALAATALLAISAPASKARKRAAKPSKIVSTCKEPAPVDADLVAGLEAYAKADWKLAANTLAAWAAKPGAEADPAASRGLYSLAFAQRSIGDAAGVAASLARVEPLLRARTESQPTLEAWYYLQGVGQMRGDTTAQLTAVSGALKAIEAGLCPERDGDDWFRIARLHSFAGNGEAKSEALRASSEAYGRQPEGAPASPYRALVEKELGDAAVTSNDLESAANHLAAAAKLDPSIPGVHRQLGLVYLKRGDIESASRHWRSNWRREREGGNAFMYALPVMNKILAYQQEPGMEPLTGLSQFTVPALEQNARSEAQDFLVLQQEIAVATEAGTPVEPEKLARMKAAEYRCLQFLLEYVTRGQDLQEFALQNGLLPVIHGKGLPKRT